MSLSPEIGRSEPSSRRNLDVSNPLNTTGDNLLDSLCDDFPVSTPLPIQLKRPNSDKFPIDYPSRTN